MVSKIVWIFGVASAKDKEIELDVGYYDEIFCHQNRGDETVPVGTVEYEIGAIRQDEQSSEHAVRNTNSLMAGLEFKYGFQKIKSLEMKLTGSYTFEHERSRKTSTLSSTTQSHKKTLTPPDLGPNRTWCAYRLATQMFDAGDSHFYFGFEDVLYTNERLHADKEDLPKLLIKGDEFDLEDPRGFMISTTKWGNDEQKGWFLYMQDRSDGNVRGWGGDPGLQGHWLFQKRHDGSYTMKTKKWDDWYMYMQDTKTGNVRAWRTDPGPQGHFVLTRHVSKNCFLISTKKWGKEWFVYMQDTRYGNVRGWGGNPGDQGCWQLTTAWTSSENPITV